MKVNHFVSKGLILDGQVGPGLKLKIIERLRLGAQGMFRWVEMSLEFLKGVRHRQDFMKHLDRLPPKLSQIYDAVYTQINEDTENARILAMDALKWLLCAQRLLSKKALIAAVYIVDSDTVSDLYEGEGQLLMCAENDILRCCRNFVILDSGRDVFRLAY